MYRLPEELEARLKHFEAAGDASLGAEMSLCRTLLEKAAADGNTTAATNLLSVLSKLAKEVELQKLRASELWNRAAASRFIRYVVEELSLEFRTAAFPGWEDRLDSLSIRLADSLTLTQNEDNVIA